MRVHSHLVLIAYLFPVLLALVVRIPEIDRLENRALLARETDSSTTKASHDATPTNATSIATSAGNSTTTTTSATTVPLLNASATDEDDNGANSTAPGSLPLQPVVTPALGVGGFILLVTGAVLALIGVRNLWIQVFLSSAYLTSLGVTVLIVYVMNPPVRIAIQGAYLVAIFFTGITFGALAIVFKELSEGLGCLLGGFCTSMWLLSTRPGGLLTETDAKTGFIGAISVGFYAISFSRYTRPYGLIVSTSMSGGTAVSLGIDFYSKAGLKEFWLYIWALNDDVFPLGTNTYPVTRYIKVELAVTVIVAIMGVISQLRLWKMVRDRRAKEEHKRQEQQKRKDEAEAEAVKRLEEDNVKERIEWEAKYGDPATDSSSWSSPELAAASQICSADGGEALRKVEAPEEESISDSVVSYRCSDCRARGNDDADSDGSGSTRRYQAQQEDGKDEHERSICATPTLGDQDSISPKAFRGTETAEDRSSGMTATVGSETGSVYSKRLSTTLSRKEYVGNSSRHMPVPQETLMAHDDIASSTQGVIDDFNDINSDRNTIAAQSHYQAMLDEEQPMEAEETNPNNDCPQSTTGAAEQPAHASESQANAISPETSVHAEPKRLQESVGKEMSAGESISNKTECEGEARGTELGSQHGEAEEFPSKCENSFLQSSARVPTSPENDVRGEIGRQAETAKGDTQSPQGKNIPSVCGEKVAAENGPMGKRQPRELEGKEKTEEDSEPERVSATYHSAEKSSKEHNIPLVPRNPEKHETNPPSEAPFKQKEEEPRRLDAETVQQLPKHMSRIVQTYRMNEWAKHLANADIPELEPIQPFEDERPECLVDEEEAAAPVKVTELMQTPLNAQPPAVESRVLSARDANETCPHDPCTSSQKKQRRSKLPRPLSRLLVGSGQNSPYHFPPAVQPQLGSIATSSSITLLSNVSAADPRREDSGRSKAKWKGPPPLIAVREDMMRNRLSSLSLPTDAYVRQSPGYSPTEFSPRHSSTFTIAEEDDDDIPLSQRRTMLHHQAPPNAFPASAHPPPPRWSHSGVPSRANSPAVLAAWRESVREDLRERSDPLKLTTRSTVATAPSERSASPFGQLGQRNASSSSIGDKIADGMQRGDMSELHREALRRMQAKANRSVNRVR
ncbi:TMEM198/TM7SF3 family protein [Aspergillus lucknowensis]|uniref:TM7S3/TM198-like domain-containing protein n=1 Tax=Aspergillus lucknowensis TaxID=176173 RepID=A0ABR4LJ75_9EURO